MNNRKDNRRTIRNAVGLPDDNAKIVGLVSEDPFEICENSIGYAQSSRKACISSMQSIVYHQPSGCISPTQGVVYHQSAGLHTSPHTEVNAENQGVVSEVPRPARKK